MRTKKESLKRLNSLNRKQLHKLSEEFTINETVNGSKLIIPLLILWSILIGYAFIQICIFYYV